MKSGTVLHCTLNLNKQSDSHSSDEFASFVDILYCQIEQLIRKTQPKARYIFDNETLTIVFFDDFNENRIEQTCRLAVDLVRFIEEVNEKTKWSLNYAIAIDANSLNIVSDDVVHGLAFDHSIWLNEQCRLSNRIHVSSTIYESLKHNRSFRFETFLSLNKNSTFLLVHGENSPGLEENFRHINTSNMIDQLTRIQAEYYVDKHLGTITLTKSLRKRSLFQLSSKSFSFLTLNFKEKSLRKEFQTSHRIERPSLFIFFFLFMILFGLISNWFVVTQTKHSFIVLFPISSIICVLPSSAKCLYPLG